MAHAIQDASHVGARNAERVFSVPCACGGSCMLCDDNGNRPIDVHDVIRLRRTALNRGFRETVRMCDRAIADDDDMIAWFHVAEALR